MVEPLLIERPLTYDDLVAMPDDGNRYELINGVLFMSPSPRWQHQVSSKRLFREFDDWVYERDLGEVLYAPFDVVFSAHNVVQPDLLYFTKERAHLITANPMTAAPDLALEILSPSNRCYDIITKAAVYATFGVREYWIADPLTKTILVQVLRGDRYVPLISEDGLAHSEVLPGFVVDPAEIFAPPGWAKGEW